MASSVDEDQSPSGRSHSPVLRMRVKAACDVCHNSKVKCSGGNPCAVCAKAKLECKYTPAKGMGRPRGVKNKKTQQRLKEAAESQQSQISPATSEPLAYSQDSMSQAGIQGVDDGFNPEISLYHSASGFATTTMKGLSSFDSQPPYMFLADSLAMSSSFLDTSHHVPTTQPMNQTVEETLLSTTNYLPQQTSNQVSNTSNPCGCTFLLATELERLQSEMDIDDRFSQVTSGIEGSLAIWKQHLDCDVCSVIPDEYQLTLLALQCRLAIERLETFCDSKTTSPYQDPEMGPGPSSSAAPTSDRSSSSWQYRLQADRDEEVTEFVTQKLSSMAEVLREARCRAEALALRKQVERTQSMPFASAEYPMSFMNHAAMDRQLQDLIGRIYKVQLSLMLTKT